MGTPLNNWLYLLAICLLLAACSCGEIRSQLNASEPQQYTVNFANQAPHINGKFDDFSWQQASWTEAFVIHDSGRRAPLVTRAKLLYSRDALYIAMSSEDRDLYAKFSQLDDPLYQRDDLLELFFDPDGDGRNYVELGISPRGMHYALLVPYAGVEDMTLVRALDTRAVELAIKLDGSLNDPSDTDRGWTLEARIPFSVFADPAIGLSPVEAGQHWRANLCRLDYNHTSPWFQAEGYYSWNNLQSFGFHKPWRFSVIELQ